jgi:hypothetical protein
VAICNLNFAVGTEQGKGGLSAVEAHVQRQAGRPTKHGAGLNKTVNLNTRMQHMLSGGGFDERLWQEMLTSHGCLLSHCNSIAYDPYF